MNKLFIALNFLAISLISLAQSDAAVYYSLINEGKSLYDSGNYEAAALAFSKAFYSTKNKTITAGNYYNAACYWSLAQNTDSAFHYLELATTKAYFHNYENALKDPDLESLHSDKRWEPLILKMESNYSTSMQYYLDSVDYSETGDNNTMAKHLDYLLHQDKYVIDERQLCGLTNDLGKSFYKNNDYYNAISWLEISADIMDNNNFDVTAPYSNLGHVYKAIGDTTMARKYYDYTLEKGIEFNNCNIIGWGYVYKYYMESNDDIRFNYLDQAHESWLNCPNREGLALGASALYKANFAYTNKDYNKSIQLLHESIQFDKIDADEGIITLNLIGYYSYYLLAKNYQAIENTDSAFYYVSLNYQQKTEAKAVAAEFLSIINLYASLAEKKGLNSLALTLRSEQITYYEEVLKNAKKSDVYFELMKREASQDSLINAQEVAIKNQEIERAHQEKLNAESENKNRKIQIYIVLAGLLIALYLGSVAYRRWKHSLKQNKIIEEKSHKIEEQNKEILDSINYAKRIQSAILPPNKIVKEYLEDSFILYKPKDVVAGDFYWMEHADGKVFFAAADCTGHGVPGAMVSVVCNNALNRSVREYGMKTPGEILDKTKELVIQEFEKSEDEVKDGMDIALCCLEGNKLSFAGAHNPLWIVRNQEIIEIKADKQPIGKFEFESPFTTHKIDLLKGDTLYIFSDGYPDQFGGDKGKKYKTGNLKKLLLSIQDHSMEKQRNLLNEEFEAWRGSIEQIDDVCIIGVRI